MDRIGFVLGLRRLSIIQSVYHKLRWLHKWGGIVACLFLATIAATGFLLAVKARFAWIRPGTAEAAAISSVHEIVPLGTVIEAACAQGLPGLKTHEDVDRLEYRVKDNIFKVTSKTLYHEVQVHGTTGKVLSVGTRNDQLFEDIHDLSFFHDLLHDWWLPVVAFVLFVLSISGGVMFFTPVVRRWKFRRTQKKT